MCPCFLCATHMRNITQPFVEKHRHTHTHTHTHLIAICPCICLFIYVSNLLNLNIHSVCSISSMYLSVYLSTYRPTCVCVCRLYAGLFKTSLTLRFILTVEAFSVGRWSIFDMFPLQQELFTCTHISRKNSVGGSCSQKSRYSHDLYVLFSLQWILGLPSQGR